MPARRVVVLTALTVILGFGGGFFIGRLDDTTLINLGLKPPKARILIENVNLFPESLRKSLEQRTGLDVEVQVFDTAKSLGEMIPYFDIFLGSRCLIENISLNSADLYQTLSLERNISPDFTTLVGRTNFAVPLLWKFSKQGGLQVISMRAKKLSSSYIQDLIAAWFKKDFVLLWSESTGLATTFMTLDESSLKPELKASWLRKISLTDLAFQDKTKCENAKGIPAEGPNRRK
jgi:hypothetical protein